MIRWNLFFEVEKVEQLPLIDSAVDVATCRNGLHQMANPGRAMAELHRAIRPSGLACLVESVAPSKKAHPEWSRILRLKDRGRHRDFYYTANDFESWVERSGFTILRTDSIEVRFDVNQWITMGGVTGPRAAAVRQLFIEASNELRTAMAIESAGEGLYANKLVHMVTARAHVG